MELRCTCSVLQSAYSCRV